MKKDKKIVTLIAVAVTLGAVYTAFYSDLVSNINLGGEEKVFCTADAKQCPDGSYVGRVGPSCEFALCPGESPDSLNMIIGDGSPEVSLEGSLTCLPHKDTSGPQTLECALGFEAKNGSFYSLDSGDMGDQLWNIPMGEPYLVTGRFTPIEALSSNYLQIYSVEGVITVTSIEKI